MTAWLSEILASSSDRPIVPLLTLSSSGWATPLRYARDRTTTSRGLVFHGRDFDLRRPLASMEGVQPGLLRLAADPEVSRLIESTTAHVVCLVEFVWGDDADTVAWTSPSMRIVEPQIDPVVIEAELHVPVFASVKWRLGVFGPAQFPGVLP